MLRKLIDSSVYFVSSLRVLRVLRQSSLTALMLRSGGDGGDGGGDGGDGGDGGCLVRIGIFYDYCVKNTFAFTLSK